MDLLDCSLPATHGLNRGLQKTFLRVQLPSKQTIMERERDPTARSSEVLALNWDNQCSATRTRIVRLFIVCFYIYIYIYRCICFWCFCAWLQQKASRALSQGWPESKLPHCKGPSKNTLFDNSCHDPFFFARILSEARKLSLSKSRRMSWRFQSQMLS